MQRRITKENLRKIKVRTEAWEHDRTHEDGLLKPSQPCHTKHVQGERLQGDGKYVLLHETVPVNSLLLHVFMTNNPPKMLSSSREHRWITNHKCKA